MSPDLEIEKGHAQVRFDQNNVVTPQKTNDYLYLFLYSTRDILLGISRQDIPYIGQCIPVKMFTHTT